MCLLYILQIFLDQKSVVILYINDLNFVIAGCCKTLGQKKIILFLLPLALFTAYLAFFENRNWQP